MSIVPGASECDVIRWVLHVNPFRRELDRGWLVDGVELAGVPGSGAGAGA